MCKSCTYDFPKTSNHSEQWDRCSKPVLLSRWGSTWQQLKLSNYSISFNIPFISRRLFKWKPIQDGFPQSGSHRRVMSARLLSGGALSQLSDSGQTLSEDSGVDIAESGHVSKDSSPHSSRTRHPRESQEGGGEPPSKPVRGRFGRAQLSPAWMDERICYYSEGWEACAVALRVCVGVILPLWELTWVIWCLEGGRLDIEKRFTCYKGPLGNWCRFCQMEMKLGDRFTREMKTQTSDFLKKKSFREWKHFVIS